MAGGPLGEGRVFPAFPLSGFPAFPPHVTSATFHALPLRIRSKNRTIFFMTNDFEGTIRDLLLHMGENPDREGLRDTPRRVAESYRFLTKGYKTDPERLIKKALFSEPHDDLVIVKDIEFYSLCEHHLLPFFGKCHIGYIPNGSIIGLSKLCRLVEVYARRLQVQERMTNQIADVLNRHLKPKGVGVVLEAQHLCMQMRGVEKQHSEAVTSAMLGGFRTRQSTREEFLKLIRAGSSHPR